MTTKGLVIFDGDDTLWAVEHLYDAALEKAQRMVSDSGLPGSEWRRLQREIDLRNVITMGMSRERFPRSSKEALDQLVTRLGVAPSEDLTTAVVAASRSVFELTAPLASAAEATLQRLSPHFLLALLTKGDEVIQKRRIDDSRLARWFDRIEIVPEKTELSFLRLVGDLGAEAERSWSVGNSLASDINPALRAGLSAIWIDAHVWEHERREVVPAHEHLVVLERLDEVVDVLLRSRAETAS